MRAQLGRFGFSRERANLKVGVMSGGEKTRLLLALATRNAPHLLLLDEPTNHLDMDARASLVDAINDFEGAVVLVSHDTHLVKMVADQLWMVADGTVKPFEGDIDEYQAKLLRERNEPARRKEPQGQEGEEGASASGRSRRACAAADRAQARHLKSAVEKRREGDGRLNKQRDRDRSQARRSRDLFRPGRRVPPTCRSEKSAWNASSPTPSTSGWWRRKPSKRLERSYLRRRAGNKPRRDPACLADRRHQTGVDDVEPDRDPEHRRGQAGRHQEAEDRRRQERADIEAGIDEAEHLARGAGRRRLRTIMSREDWWCRRRSLRSARSGSSGGETRLHRDRHA